MCLSEELDQRKLHMSANRKWKLSVNWIRDLLCQKGMIWYNWRPVISHCLYLPVYLTLGKSSPVHLIPTLIYQKRSARGRDDNHHQFVRTKWDTQETFLTLWNHYKNSVTSRDSIIWFMATLPSRCWITRSDLLYTKLHILLQIFYSFTLREREYLINVEIDIDPGYEYEHNSIDRSNPDEKITFLRIPYFHYFQLLRDRSMNPPFWTFLLL